MEVMSSADIRLGNFSSSLQCKPVQYTRRGANRASQRHILCMCLLDRTCSKEIESGRMKSPFTEPYLYSLTRITIFVATHGIHAIVTDRNHQFTHISAYNWDPHARCQQLITFITKDIGRSLCFPSSLCRTSVRGERLKHASGKTQLKSSALLPHFGHEASVPGRLPRHI